ncbi:hypothetical protein H4R35_003112 [Dimargaris xerosporica]|nr:hypothetical protein H4R35_003112 [Dimargaris xerosporica]
MKSFLTAAVALATSVTTIHGAWSPESYVHLVTRGAALTKTDAGRCDANSDYSDGLCCSWWGWKGSTPMHCNPGTCLYNCAGGQNATLAQGMKPSQDGRCDATTICPDGGCCSMWGYCGTGVDFCGSSVCGSQCPGHNDDDDDEEYCEGQNPFQSYDDLPYCEDLPDNEIPEVVGDKC